MDGLWGFASHGRRFQGLADHNGGPWIHQAPTFLLVLCSKQFQQYYKHIIVFFARFSVCLLVSVQLVVLFFQCPFIVFSRGVGAEIFGYLQRLYCLQSVWVGRLWHSQLFVAFMRHSGWLFCGTQKVCSFLGALRLDPCGVYSVNSVYWALGLDVCGVLQCLQHLWGIGAVCLALGSCLAFVCFYMLSMGGCLQVWSILAQASPSYEPLLSELGIQLGGPFGLVWGLMTGGHWFAGHGCVTLSRAWLCQKWKPLELLISYKQP